MRIEFYANGLKRRVTVRGLFETPQSTERPSAVMRTLPAVPLTAGWCFSALEEETVRVVPVEGGAPTVIPTEAMSIGGARAIEVTRLRSQFGMELVEEGSHGKALLTAPQDADDPVRLVARAATAVFERSRVECAQPNFLRLIEQPELTTTEAPIQWALDSPGRPGMIGAGIAAMLERTAHVGRALRASGSTQVALVVGPFSTRHLPEHRLTATGYQENPRVDRESIARLMDGARVIPRRGGTRGGPRQLPQFRQRSPPAMTPRGPRPRAPSRPRQPGEARR